MRALPLLLVPVVLGALAGVPAVAQSSAGAPTVIPALQEWASASGAWTLTASTRVVVDDEMLQGEATTLVDDLRDLAGVAPAIVSAAAPGDIVLRLTDVGLPTDGYELDVTPAALTIAAPTSTGVFHGTRTLLQLLSQDERIAAGTARDWPRYPDRGFMADAGRKHLDADWIEQHIKELAWLKMNIFHYHLSDHPGFRVELESHPEVVSEDHLTKAEVAHLVDVARRYHVEIIPEVDLPGHATFLLAHHPEFQLRDITGTPNPQALDITSEDARAFVREIIEEVLGMFPGRWYHGGGDEFIHLANQPLLPAEPAYPTYPDLLTYAQGKYGLTAVHKDAYLDFLNWLNDVARDNGRALRLWADGMHGGSAVTLDTDIVAEWWQFHALTASPTTLVDAGMEVLNAGWMPGYYAVAGFAELSGQKNWPEFWDGWEVHEFWGIEQVLLGGSVPPREQLPPDSPANRGAKAHLWHDEPDLETLEQSTIGICPLLRLIAQKTWESPTDQSWNEFMGGAAAIGRAPGFDFVDDASCPLSSASAVPGGPSGQPTEDEMPTPTTGGGLALGGVIALVGCLATRRAIRA